MLTKEDYDQARQAVIEKFEPTEQETLERPSEGINLEPWGPVPSGTDYQFWMVINPNCKGGFRAKCYVFKLNGVWKVVDEGQQILQP